MMKLIKISVTSQQFERLSKLKNETGLSCAETFRRAFDFYIINQEKVAKP